MRLAIALALPLLAAGCLGQEPASREPTGEATPEGACADRGLAPLSCDTYCGLHPDACGIAPPPVVRPPDAWMWPPPAAPPTDAANETLQLPACDALGVCALA